MFVCLARPGTFGDTKTAVLGLYVYAYGFGLILFLLVRLDWNFCWKGIHLEYLELEWNEMQHKKR